MANDPSQNVQGDLLPHIHLLSTYRYPLMPRLDLQDVTAWLLGAPKIARDTAPFFWTYLDAPQDGSIYLTWQPLSRRGTEFATDGYVWPSVETYLRQDVGNGLVLEIFFQKCGYRNGEAAASHSRRRFRLTPPQVAAPNTPQVDPSLWIVHYGPAEKNDRFPVHMLHLPPPLQQILNFRQQLLSMGQIVRKEFMLSDRVNWPQIPLPGRGNAMYAPPVHVRGVPQTMAYPPQGPAGVGGPAPKRRGLQGQQPPPQQMAPHHHHQQAAMFGAVASLDAAYDDEEDTSRGDMFDHLTPREVSIARYQQNHEWMEEILSSPYRINQIVAADLGLGLKGELAPLTEGIFEAQGSEALTERPRKPYVGHLDGGLADEFRKRAHDKMEATKAEIDRIQAEHDEAMVQLKRNEVLKQAEDELRFSVQETGPESWRLEGRLEEGEEGAATAATSSNDEWPQQQQQQQQQQPAQQPQQTSIEDILARVEATLGKHATTVHEVQRVQDGGYREPQPEPEPVAQAAPQGAAGEGDSGRHESPGGSHHSGMMIGDSDMDMGGTAAGLLDQMHTGLSTPTPGNNFPTPQTHQLSTVASSAATPAMNAASPRPATTTQEPLAATAPAATGTDVRMEDAASKAETTTAPDQGTDSGDWVIVPKTEAAADSTQPPTSDAAAAAAAAASATDAKPTAEAPASSQPASAAPTPGSGLVFDNDQNDYSSLGDLDTAGDALAGYDPPSVDAGADLGDGLDLHMDMEDSAFGDAFHGVEQSGELGDGESL